MNAPADKRAKRLNRLQNLAIVLLTLSAVFLFMNLPLFGPLSDRSLFALARDRLRRESIVAAPATAESPHLVLPIRIVYTNDFARFGSDSLTTLSDEFELAGTYLGEALGSADAMSAVSESAFLSALRAKGLYFDFTAALPSDILAELLGVDTPEFVPDSVRRMLLSPVGEGDAALYLEDGSGQYYRFSTAVNSPALVDFLASQSGSGAEFAFLLGPDYAQLSPYTLVVSEPSPRLTLEAENALSGNEDEFLRRAGFSTHVDNRFTESSGTVIVREVSSALYLRPDGTVDYQGVEVAPDSVYFVPAAASEAPTRSEAASAAQSLVSKLLRDLTGDAELCLSGATGSGGHYNISFDLMVDGTPIRFSDGSHAASVTVVGRSVTSFTLKVRRYTLSERSALLLPFSQAAAIARVWDGSEPVVAYVDGGGEEVPPAWIAE